MNDLASVEDHAQINKYSNDTEIHHCDDDLQAVQSNLQSDINRIQLVAASQLTDYNLILQSL